MHTYYFVPFIIIFNSYIISKRLNEIYDIITIQNYNVFNIIYISLFSIINLYNIFATYSLAFILSKYIKKYNFNIDNKVIMINFIDINSDEKECPICIQEYTILDNDICKLIQCTHIYHKKCIKEWYKQSKKFICPMCNTKY